MFEHTIPGFSVREVPVAERPAVIARLLNKRSALMAEVVDLVARGGIESTTGLSVEMMLQVEAGLTYSEARTVAQAAAMLREMPVLASLFRRGVVTWGQVRGVVYSISAARLSDRAEIDELIGSRAPSMAGAAPEALIELVDDEVARRRPDLVLAREERAIKHNALWFQGRLGGGSDIRGTADAEYTATLTGALDLLADDPVHPDDGASRAQQHMEALVRMAEATLSGASGGEARPRPRLLATFDVAGLSDEAREQGMTLLTSLTGRRPRLSNVARDALLCDATVVPVIFDGPRVIEVGDASTTFSDKVRTAIITRDRRCRFCSRAPAAWCDVHHLVPGRGNTADDGCLLCRRCHRRVHRYGWIPTWLEDGVLEFRRGRKKFLSLPP